VWSREANSFSHGSGVFLLIHSAILQNTITRLKKANSNRKRKRKKNINKSKHPFNLAEIIKNVPCPWHTREHHQSENHIN